MKILIIGNRAGTHIGGCFEKAALELNHDVQVLESHVAMAAPFWMRRYYWWFRGKRPAKLLEFGQAVLAVCQKWKPDYILATGIAPLDQAILKKLGALGTYRINYLTDDPWNSSHRANWFMRALPSYDIIVSVRRTNLEDLYSIGCKKVFYLPFAYQPNIHFPEEPASLEEKSQLSSDIIFAGGGDIDRVPYITALLQTGVKVALYGTYWDRFQQTRDHTHGQANISTLRKAITCSKVALCLVRRANRDGNSMRTFELPAIGACMLVEETQEHREIFGNNRECVVYFNGTDQMVDQLKWLLENNDERARLKKAAHERITQGHHTYKDRLLTIFEAVNKK